MSKNYYLLGVVAFHLVIASMLFIIEISEPGEGVKWIEFLAWTVGNLCFYIFGRNESK